MAHFYICDRCGRRVPADRAILQFRDKLHYLGVITRHIDESADLCNECYNSFLNWYHEKGAVLDDGDCNSEKRDETEG